ncbi:MAG: hypothetical protein R2818_09455 [Flavobacteriales bacterium]
MTRFALIISSPLLAVAVAAQVAVDRPIELTGVNAEQHQVTGVPSSLAPDAILAADVEGSGVHRSAQAAITTSWTIDLPALSSAPILGTHLMVLAPAGSVGDVELSVNGAGPYPLVTGPGENFAPVDLSEGTPLSIVFDGSVFHVMNGGTYERKPCATGTIAVNEQFCGTQRARWSGLLPGGDRLRESVITPLHLGRVHHGVHQTGGIGLEQHDEQLGMGRRCNERRRLGACFR